MRKRVHTIVKVRGLVNSFDQSSGFGHQCPLRDQWTMVGWSAAVK